MKILKLEASNIKRVRVVEINPDGSVVLVTGRNAQGKSSVLDAIVYALGGKDSIPDQPLREGADAGFIRLDLGDVVVERTFTADNTYLKVRAAGTNAEYPTPQALLDGLVGKIAFDPLAFARMKAKDQLTALLEVTNLGLDLDALAAERKTLFDERTDVNRDVKRFEDALGALPAADDTPGEPIAVADLVKKIEDLNAKAARAIRDDEQYQAAGRALQKAHAEVERLDAEYARFAEGAQNRGWWDDDIAALEEINARVRAKKERDEFAIKAIAAQAVRDNLTANIEEIDARKAAALAGATFPVAGLSFDEDGVLYDGRPLEQASSAELTGISTAVAMAANPTLRVILIKDGSLLDADNLKIIAKMATANDYQVWIEKVDASGEMSVVIEDGYVVGAAAIGEGEVAAKRVDATYINEK